jgi:hypothetical protein
VCGVGHEERCGRGVEAEADPFPVAPVTLGEIAEGAVGAPVVVRVEQPVLDEPVAAAHDRRNVVTQVSDSSVDSKQSRIDDAAPERAHAARPGERAAEVHFVARL